MPTETETDEAIPAWLPPAVLGVICADASGIDPSRAKHFAVADVERVRCAIDRADDLLAARHCFGDDDAIDMALSRAALIVARAMIRPTEQAHGD